MDVMETIFRCRAFVPERALDFGFTREDGVYRCRRILRGSGFEMTVYITQEGAVSASVIDPVFGAPYTLHLTAAAAGRFVGGVREEYERILREIADTCFVPDVFSCAQTRRLIAYVRERYGDELEYLWKKSPRNAVWRRKDTKKWYAVVLTVSTEKLGVAPARMAEMIDLRIPPEDMDALIDCKRYFPGWHMNKRHWYTMILDGSVPFEELCRRVDESYRLAVK